MFYNIVASTMLHDVSCFLFLHDTSIVGYEVFHSKLSAFLHMCNLYKSATTKQETVDCSQSPIFP